MLGRRLLTLGVVVVCGFCAVARYPSEALDPGPLQSTRYYDRHNELLYEARSKTGGYGHWVELEAVAPAVLWATLASEDHNFYRHPGVDPVGIARAVWLNLDRGRPAFGGSTITQQLAKLLDQKPRTLRGKAREAIDALRLELSLGKDQILAQYLNRAYYGRLSYGIEAASQRYFGKSSRELSLGQAVLLAIQPRSPSGYDPEKRSEAARQRRKHVLQLMQKRGFITESQARAAANEPFQLIDARQKPLARHVLDYFLTRTTAGRTQITTSIDLELQQGLNARLEQHLRDLSEFGATQAGIVVLDNATGEVLAMVGSREYMDAQHAGAFNATTANRPPGSTLKPFLYALGMERGRHASTPILDVPTDFNGYRPRSAAARHQGLLSQREALGSSLNVPAVRLADELGTDLFAELLHELDLHRDPRQHWLSLALGGTRTRLVDLANAYATLARAGLHGAWTLERNARPVPLERVLDARAAFLVTRMLSDPAARQRAFGLETPLDLGFPAAVKTGTSQAFCDNLTVGYTPEITVAAWVGNFDGTPLKGSVAMKGAAPLWRDAMQLAMQKRPRRPFEVPLGLSEVEVCPQSGLRHGRYCPGSKSELVFREHANLGTCHWHGHDGLKLPAELLTQRQHGDVKALGETSLDIINPRQDSRFVVDPLIARSRQRILLQAAVGDPRIEKLRWRVNNTPIAEVQAPFDTSWAIRPGNHRISAEGVSRSGSVIVSSAVDLIVTEHGKI